MIRSFSRFKKSLQNGHKKGRSKNPVFQIEMSCVYNMRYYYVSEILCTNLQMLIRYALVIAFLRPRKVYIHQLMLRYADHLFLALIQ